MDSRKKKNEKYKVHREPKEFYQKLTPHEINEKKEKDKTRGQKYRQRQHEAAAEIVK